MTDTTTNSSSSDKEQDAMDKIEAALTETERVIYREEKAVNQLFRIACGEDQQASRQAMQDLRKLFYEKKRALETLQAQPKETRSYAEMGRLTNLCKNIVALFNDMGQGLHERSSSAAGSIVRGDTSIILAPSDGQRVMDQQQQHLPGRHYTGLTEENT